MSRMFQCMVGSLLSVSLVLALPLAGAVTSPAHAQAVGPGLHFVGLLSAVAGTTPSAAIVQSGTHPPIYAPNYIPNCVSTANPAIVIVNKTTTSQSLTNLPDQSPFATLSPGQAAGFTVSGTPPFFLPGGLLSNPHTAILLYCAT